MKRIINNKVIKNKNGEVRSGWIIFLVMVAFYAFQYIIPELFIKALAHILTITGDLNPLTGESSELIDWLNFSFLPIFLQILTEIITIAVVIVTWRVIMKHPLREMGFVSIEEGKKEGIWGMLLGIISCTLALAVLLLTGQAYIVSRDLEFGFQHFWWIITMITVAFGEELLNRSLLMSVLRRSGNIYAVALIPSVIFGLIHLVNPNVTMLSVINIILAGLLFSYMFIKSGNIWMCIGYHFTWNVFQSVIYGLPVSGLNLPGIIKTEFTVDNIINGGSFGIEGGIMATAVIIAGFIFVKYYYRNIKYDFITNTYEQ